MAKWEHWVSAYLRMLKEVQEEHPDWTDHEQYAEYSARCKAWKAERGIQPSPRHGKARPH